MNVIAGFVVLFALLYLTLAAVAQDSGRYDIRGQYKLGQYNPYYNDQYFRNRELYNKRRYYENFYKKYNPDIEAKKAVLVEQAYEPIKEDGSYAYLFETENGIHNEARGTLINLDNGDQAQKVQGFFSYVTPEGIRVAIQYLADEKGYRPVITYDAVNAKQFIRSQSVDNVKNPTV